MSVFSFLIVAARASRPHSLSELWGILGLFVYFRMEESLKLNDSSTN